MHAALTFTIEVDTDDWASEYGLEEETTQAVLDNITSGVTAVLWEGVHAVKVVDLHHAITTPDTHWSV